MFDYNDDHHNDQHNNLTAVITASNLDFGTDIRFDNDTFSIDNGNLLALFSTMHQAEELRNVSFIKYDESLYANFPQSYVNKIHVDFLENLIRASVVIKVPSVEEEDRLVKEITAILEPHTVSTDSTDLVHEDEDTPTVANSFLNPEAPSLTFADSPDADAAFHDLLSVPGSNSGHYDLPAPDITAKPANTDDDTHSASNSGQYDLPAPDITDKPAHPSDETLTEDFAASDSLTPADYTDNTKDKQVQDVDDLYLSALYDSMFLW